LKSRQKRVLGVKRAVETLGRFGNLIGAVLGCADELGGRSELLFELERGAGLRVDGFVLVGFEPLGRIALALVAFRPVPLSRGAAARVAIAIAARTTGSPVVALAAGSCTAVPVVARV